MGLTIGAWKYKNKKA